MSATSSVATMTVTVEVTTSAATYGDDWKIGDLRDQVKRETTQMLRNVLKHDLIRIIGEPTVNVVRMEEKP